MEGSAELLKEEIVHQIHCQMFHSFLSFSFNLSYLPFISYI